MKAIEYGFAFKQLSMQKMGPPPPPYLSRDKLALWKKWVDSQDTSIVREAANKGDYMDLAVTFISSRRKVPHGEAQQFFHKEILTWTHELIGNKQVHRATHILNNVNMDVSIEITRIFCDTLNYELRQHLGQHLEGLEKMDLDLKNNWILLNKILENNLLECSKIEPLTITNVLMQTKIWKSDRICDIFFKSSELILESFLIKEVFWEKLLQHKQTELLLQWIELNFNKDSTNHDLSTNLQCSNEKILEYFSKNKIGQSMIDKISLETRANSELQNIILNKLAKYGIIVEYEQKDIKAITSRFNNARILDNFEHLLENNEFALKKSVFETKLVEYLTKHKLYPILNNLLYTGSYINEKSCEQSDSNVEMMLYTKNFMKNENVNDTTKLSLCILKYAEYINKDLQEYFVENPMLLVAYSILTNQHLNGSIKCDGNIEISRETVDVVRKQLPLLDLSIKKLYETAKIPEFSYHELIQRQLRICSREISNFTPKSLQNLAYSKRLDYTFYIRQGMPVTAKQFYIKNHNIYEPEQRNSLVKQIFRICMKHFNDSTKTSSCIAFLELLEIDSFIVRVHTQIANVLYENEKILEENDKQRIISAMLDVYNNPAFVYTLAEDAICGILNKNLDDNNTFIDNIKVFDLLVNFSRIHKVPLPSKYLQFLAEKDNYLQFFVYIQLYNYPVEQTRVLIEYFTDRNLSENLNYAVTNNLVYDGGFMRERNVRSSYLARLGVRRNEDMDKSMTLSLHSTNSMKSLDLEIDDGYIPNFSTLLWVLSKSHNSTDPPRHLMNFAMAYNNPLCALFAVSYEPDCVLTAWLVWVTLTCNLQDEYTSIEAAIGCPVTVKEILLKTIEKRHLKTLFMSFKIFQPEHILTNILEIIMDSANHEYDLQKTTKILDSFNAKLNQMGTNSQMEEFEKEYSYFHNRFWVEDVTYSVICYSLHYNFNSRSSQVKFVKFLKEISLENHIAKIKNIYNISNVLMALGEHDILCPEFKIISILDEETYKKEVLACATELLNNKSYNRALEVAKFGEILPDFILIKEWEESNFETAFAITPNFWNICDENFKENSILPENAANFYVTMIENCRINAAQKYEILLLAYRWCRLHNLKDIYEVERSVWSLYINLSKNSDDFTQLNDSSTSNLLSEMNVELNNMFSDVSRKDLSCYASVASENLCCLMEKLLEVGDLWQILKLEKLFGYEHLDTKIVKYCLLLAEGLLTPDGLNNHQFSLIKYGKHGRKNFDSFGKITDAFIDNILAKDKQFLTAEDCIDFPDIKQQEPLKKVDNTEQCLKVLQTIEKFSNCLVNGQHLGQKIFRMYRISLNTKMSYQKIIVTSKPLELVKEALEKNCNNKLEVVTDFIIVFDWTKEQVSDFICEQLIEVTNKAVESRSIDSMVLWDLKIDSNFHQVYQLIPDNCSVLGYKLFTFATALFKSQTNTEVEYKLFNFIPIIELLIKSHDCFTNDCNMEGITMVLKKCHRLIEILLKMKEWKYMVRLLTGVARYTEMNYIFEALYANEQFEYLLTKSSSKDSALKVALLEYLRKNCPENDELYKMVALRFGLYSEIAELWEKEAENTIKTLMEIAKLDMESSGKTSDVVLLSTTDENKSMVKKAMEYFAHAAEYHILGDKLTRAMNSAKMAELLALQSCVLKQKDPVSCILKLNSEQITQIISTSSLDFQQVILLTEAYEYEVKWSNVLFQRCIAEKDNKFLEDFLNHEKVTDSLILDISNRYVACGGITQNSVVNMKKLLGKVKSVNTKYKVASKLSFLDIVEELLQGNKLAYLKDTVWKYGYHKDPLN